MSNKSTATVTTMRIDIGKNSFHVVGLGLDCTKLFNPVGYGGISKDGPRLTPSNNHCAAHRIWASDVRVGSMLSKKVFLAGELNFAASRTRLTRASVRGHMASQEIDHRASYVSY